MRASLDDVVLKIILMEQHQPARVANPSELPEARPIPRVEFRQIIFAQAVPRRALAAAREGLLEERRQHVARRAADALMIVAAQIVPEAVVMVQRDLVPFRHFIGEQIQFVREARPAAPGHKARERRTEGRSLVRTKAAAPPRHFRAVTDQELAVHCQPAVGNDKRRVRSAECGVRS